MDLLKPLSLVATRLSLGFIMIWAFLDKMFGLGLETPSGQGFVQGGSPSSFVVYVCKGPAKGLFDAMAGNLAIDVILLLALLILGVTLILGFASKLTTIGMIAFLFIMYIACFPPSDNPFVDYHLVYIFAMFVLYTCGGFEVYSIEDRWKDLSLVKRFPILE